MILDRVAASYRNSAFPASMRKVRHVLTRSKNKQREFYLKLLPGLLTICTHWIYTGEAMSFIMKNVLIVDLLIVSFIVLLAPMSLIVPHYSEPAHNEAL